MVFTSREKTFCVLEYARTNSNKNVQRAFVRKFNEVTNSKADSELEKEIRRRRLPVQSKRIWTTSNSRRKGRVVSPNTLAKPQKVYKKNKYGDPDTSNDSLAGSKETFGNETLQTAGRSGHNCS